MVRDGLKIQHRFSAAPVYARTGRGQLKSEGVGPLQKIKRRLKADEAHIIRSLAGHIVAGTASDVEATEFVKFSRNLSKTQLK